MKLFIVQPAELTDLDAIKSIADSNKHSLGFVPRVKIREAVEANRVKVLRTPEEVAGFVIYRHRKRDLQTTLSEICVADSWRNQSGGRLLIDTLYEECEALKREFILLKCPEDLPANDFYSAVGFKRIKTEAGRVRKLNVWQLIIHQAVEMEAS